MTKHTLSNYELFEPAYGLRHRHFQTIFPSLFRKQPRPEIEIERFELSDGDFVECYWHHQPVKESHRPIVVLFHGLEGSFESRGFNSEVQHMKFQSLQMTSALQRKRIKIIKKNAALIYFL